MMLNFLFLPLLERYMIFSQPELLWLSIIMQLLQFKKVECATVKKTDGK